MIQHNNFNVELSNLQTDKLKLGIKNDTEETLKIYQILLVILMMRITFYISYY